MEDTRKMEVVEEAVVEETVVEVTPTTTELAEVKEKKSIKTWMKNHPKVTKVAKGVAIGAGAFIVGLGTALVLKAKNSEDDEDTLLTDVDDEVIDGDFNIVDSDDTSNTSEA